MDTKTPTAAATLNMLAAIAALADWIEYKGGNTARLRAVIQRTARKLK